VNGVDIGICKSEFLDVHDLRNSHGMAENIAKDIYLGQSMPVPDQRGKHFNHPNKITTESLESVHQHIAETPKYQRHCSRNQNPGKVYMDCELTIASLYHQYYIPLCQEQDIIPVSEDKHRRIFCTSYNIDFELPKFDMWKCM
jgi:hypothetical protein